MMFNWRRKPVNPTLVIEFKPETKSIDIKADWAAFTEAESLEAAKSLATTIFLLNNGELLRNLEFAVNKRGETDKRTASFTLDFLNEAFRAQNKPVVDPRVALKRQELNGNV